MNYNKEQNDKCEKVEELKADFKKSRFLFVCQNCFVLKPPIIVEIGNSPICSWCSKKRDDLLLLGTKLDDNVEDVEYFVIRKFDSTFNSAKECKKNLGLKWKYCQYGEKCKFAHSKIELRVWELESKFNIERSKIVKYFNFSQINKYSYLKGVFHCAVCSKNLLSGKDFSNHCDSISHKHFISTQESKAILNWKHRPMPDFATNIEELTLCSRIENSCPDGNQCSKAHSQDELQEWIKRLQIQKEKLQFASKTGLMSFTDQVLHEYNSSSSPASVMKSSIPGVKVTVNFKRNQKIFKKKFTWTVKIRCTDFKEKLNHAAFITRTGRKKKFKICRCLRKKHSKAFSHLDFKIMLSDNYSLNLQNGEAAYMVKFKTEHYGSYSSFLVLEFRNKPRPVLKIDFNVEVINPRYSDISDILKLTDVTQKPETLSWERDREIIQFEKPFANDFDKALLDLMMKYKSPDAALDFIAERHATPREIFDPIKMTAKDYVQEMHRFLYREEKTRSERLSGVRPFSITLSSNCMPNKSGIYFCQSDQLFAVFDLPDHLSRDTEEGLLIFENCNQALIGRKNETMQPVYEALIEEKFPDHVVLRLSRRCVLDWQLVSGQVVDVEIQFQLDRERFCRCHFALDQLKENNRLRLVCPNFKSRREANKTSMFSDNSFYDTLDEEQRKVLTFLESENHSAQGSSLFVVQGSFGTGKTYTISQCIKHLIETDDDARILICTHSNSAACVYFENNFQDVQQWKDKVIRVVYHARKESTLSKLEFQYCLRHNNQFRYPTAKEVASHKIFVTTFETSLVLGVLGTGLIGAFTHIFLDEVAQTMEAAAIIPLTLADAKTKVVIAGDHKQITEKVYSKKKQFEDSRFTLLERLYKLYQENMPSHLIVLRKNYRSIPPILELIELLFYREKMLQSCTETLPLPNLVPIQFHDVEGSCKKNPHSGDYYNEAEAQKVTDVVDELLQTYPEQLQQIDVAVVASYNDQVRIIRSFMRRMKMNNVDVERVRNIQGREFKVVVISCVHNRETRDGKERENLGLLSNRNLLNTALTRTKLAVITVGHAVTLWSVGKCHIMWREYIQKSKNLGGLFPLDLTIENIKSETFLKNFSSLNPFAVEFVLGSIKRQSTQSIESNQQEKRVQDLDDVANEEETLPLKDDILDDIVKNVIGIKPEKIEIEVDKSGQEFPVEQIEDNEGDDQNGRGKDNSDYPLDELNKFLRTQPNKYKRCIINMNNWNSAIADLLDADEDFQCIYINSREDLGHSFDKDKVVVHITLKEKRQESPDEQPKLVVYGKVIGVLSNHNHLADVKFVCVPDKFNPGFMCPIDRKITKFLIQGRERTRNKIPIFKLNDKGKLKKKPDFIKFDKYAIALDDIKHYVVRYVKWPANSKYPIGYVSEEIKPNEFEKYYSLVYDVPLPEHPKSVVNEAKQLSKCTTTDHERRDFSDLFVFTIDPEGSKDLDDAMSLQRCSDHDDCWKIGIHITDVASVVPAGSKVDLEAQKRATTFYSGRQEKFRTVIHMLPTSLSSDECSLLPDGKKRLTISIFIHSSILPDLSGEQTKSANLPEPILSYVKSRRQMTYLEAENEMRNVRKNGMDENKLLRGSNENNIGEQLIVIWQTLLRLRIKRTEFSAFYVQPEFDDFNQFCQDASAHMLIEEAMFTYNACCSLYLHKKECEIPLRIQDQPLHEKSLLWMKNNRLSISRSLYQQACLKNTVGVDALDDLMAQDPEDNVIQIIPIVWHEIKKALESRDLETALILFSSDAIQPGVTSGQSRFIAIQPKAQIQTNKEVFRTRNPGEITHFSLRLSLYSQFSSPIRRYSDLQSQRLIIGICSKKQKDSNVLDASSSQPKNMEDFSKKLSQLIDSADDYEKKTRNFHFALQLCNQQNFEIAYVNNLEERGAWLSFLDLQILSSESCLLRFSDIKLSSKEESSIIWKLKYFDINMPESSNQSMFSPNDLTGVAVSSSDWNKLLKSIKSSISSLEIIDSKQSTFERIKRNFDCVWQSRQTSPSCPRSTEFGPCSQEKCVKSKSCRDHLDGLSRLKIHHHRKITMSLSLGTSMLVQLYGGMKEGRCVPSLQLLNLARDLDICLAHNSSPIETFAADIRPKERNNFRNLKDYMDFWIPLSRMEAIYKSVKDNSNCIILQNILINFSQPRKKLVGSFSLKCLFCEERFLEIAVDDFLCIRVKCLKPLFRSNDSSDTKSISHKKMFTWVLHAVVTSSEKEGSDQNFKFESCFPVVADLKIPEEIAARGGKIPALVEVIQLGISHRAIASTLKNVINTKTSDFLDENGMIANDLCLGQIIICEDPNQKFNVIKESVGTDIVPGMKHQLNEGQIKQIKNALGQKISMIQGPPGTGKSFVGAHLAHYFHLCNKLSNRPKKILYCGPSNKSVDVVAEYLLDSNQLKVLRVYGKMFEEEDYPNPLKPPSQNKETEKRPSKNISNISLHQKIRRENKPFADKIKELDSKFRDLSQNVTYKDYKTWKKLIAQAKFDEFKNHDVIICTCATAAGLKKSLLSPETKTDVDKVYRFSQCIIDECGMCSEPETLVPIIASKAQKVVLIGDHQQLQPIILSRRARDFGLGVSMFERLHKHAGMLTTQYRMDEAICDFPSRNFYNGSLKTNDSVFKRERGRLFRFCHPTGSCNTAVFCHVVGTEKVNFSLDRGGESSYYNEEEAKAVIKVLRYFHRNDVSLSDVMILSPYSAQVTTIRNLIIEERADLKEVHIGTVVTSQGSERDFVILSTVRSLPEFKIGKHDLNIGARRKHIGFVSDPHQINVAITRARSGLCIVGNSLLLEKDSETWKPLIQSYKDRGSLVNADDCNAPWNQVKST